MREIERFLSFMQKIAYLFQLPMLERRAMMKTQRESAKRQTWKRAYGWVQMGEEGNSQRKSYSERNPP